MTDARLFAAAKAATAWAWRSLCLRTCVLRVAVQSRSAMARPVSRYRLPAGSAGAGQAAPAAGSFSHSAWAASSVWQAGMDFLIGFTGKDYAIVAADANAARSIMVYSQELDKIRVVDTHKLLAVGGDAADCINEPEYIMKNVALYAMRNGVQLTTHATANYIRGEKAYNLRKAMAQVRPPPSAERVGRA